MNPTKENQPKTAHHDEQVNNCFYVNHPFCVIITRERIRLKNNKIEAKVN